MSAIRRVTLPLALLCSAATTQEPITTLRLWPTGDPQRAEVVTERGAPGSDRFVRDITDPTLTVYLPERSAARRAAVLICPGGGYAGLAIDKEGHDVARWLVGHGIAGLVLKYRMPRTADAVIGHAAPLADAHRAVRIARQRADEWGIDPGRVGILGFSAGGHLASSAAVHTLAGDPDAAERTERHATRPDFCILVYPVVSMRAGVTHSGSRARLLGTEPVPELVDHYSSERHVDARTPPTFLVHTQDDPVKVENSLNYHRALVENGVPAALHVFARGGHGYGMIQRGLPVNTWPELCIAWLRDEKILAKKATRSGR